MTLLTIGLVFWVLVHFFKRVAPGARGSLDDALGQGPAKGIIALLIIGSLVLMIVGYRAAPFDSVYTPIAGMGHLNNLLMIVAVVLMGAGSSTGRARSLLRHPMLTGAIIWAVAHLLVNGDQASVLLFGGIGLWAFAQIFLINRAKGPWDRPEPGPVSGDVRLLVISAVLYGVVAGVHFWLGYSPLLGTYG
ncbi:MAG: NnrU family protein [Rhodobacteraceae bacterium]|nr:NnrU family protein [Paracoccaceae bacterium]